VNDFMADVIFFEQSQIPDIASVDVFFISFFELFEDLVKVLDFFLVVVEDFFEDGFAFDSETEEGKDLIDDIGLGIFFGVLEDGELFHEDFIVGLFECLLRVIMLGVVFREMGLRVCGYPFMIESKVRLGLEGKLILVG
jgi:hypothetical protein